MDSSSNLVARSALGSSRLGFGRTVQTIQQMHVLDIIIRDRSIKFIGRALHLPPARAVELRFKPSNETLFVDIWIVFSR